MVFDKQALRSTVLIVGIFILLMGLLAMPAQAQSNEDGNQYTDKVCDVVITIIASNNANNEQNHEATSGGDTLNNGSIQGTTTGNNNVDNNLSKEDITGDNVNEIAQELNVSPSVVQNCIKGNDDEIGGKEDNAPGNNGAGKNQYDNNNNDNNTPDDNNNDDNIINVPNKAALPNTGGLPLLPAVGFSLIVGAGLLTAVVRRRS